MVISHVKEVKGVKIEGLAAKGIQKKVLVSPAQGWQGYVMRSFELDKGGYTPRHTHPWPHINYITGGRGKLFLDGMEYALEEGSFAYIPSGKEHQFSQEGEETFSLLCIVPEEGEI